MKQISKLLKLIATGSASLVLAACYGVPAEMGVPRFLKVEVKDSSNATIPNIEIKWRALHSENWEDTVITNDSGVAQISIFDETIDTVELIVTDIDSSDNGEYATVSDTVSANVEEKIIKLSKK